MHYDSHVPVKINLIELFWLHLKQKAFEQANDVKMEGNRLFGSGQYEEALSQYELAYTLRLTCHHLWNYAQYVTQTVQYVVRNCMQVVPGKYEDAIKECTKALELNPSYMKALLRRAEAHEKLEHFEEAIADMKKILELDPSNDQAKRTIRRLGPLAEEKREKMKEEMIGKLKDMGNSLLGHFGMSVDNFKSVKDPNTGSYSISFQLRMGKECGKFIKSEMEREVDIGEGKGAFSGRATTGYETSPIDLI
ncbi:Tetratricopeptide repeat-like superfamily protein [Prunus dulcis]|uniref:Tetratricopeptide repeat-like superfamily protein n=1 Tax=Prunus dulcis TaxID=3755 RepID=A0A4Y1QMB6_PRUDU|nr:Tetratricopeptide repeat-like superfamily protein [Prunus dulcis]